MYGYVFYPDGGCYPQNEYSGAGLHGYRWNLGLTAKGIGHASNSATFRGYTPKADSFDFTNKEEKNKINEMPREEFIPWVLSEDDGKLRANYRVPLERYYDAVIPLEYGGTNNTAELNATIHCLEHIVNEPDFADTALVVIRQDARYVVDGHNVYMPNWLAKDFIRRDGTPVPNSDLWRRFNTITSQIKDLGVHVHFEWVRGHGTCIGNNSADELATAARIIAKSPKEIAKHDASFQVSEVTDYWASQSESRHPMLCHRFMYIGVDEAERERKEYYLSTQGRVAELDGKRTSDDGFSVVRCKPQSHIEEVVAKQVSIPREIDYRFKVDLDKIYGSDTRYLEIYGTGFLHRALENKRHLQTYGKVIVTEELHPPFLVERIFDNTDILCDYLDNYKDTTNQPTMHVTDITSEFFTITEELVKGKKGEESSSKTIYTISSDMPTGYFSHKVVAKWKESDGEIKECDITLRLGIDLPDRNTLRRLGDLQPKVLLVTNTMGPGSFMYAVVIEAGEDVGIWSGIQSSMRITLKVPAPIKLGSKAK